MTLLSQSPTLRLVEALSLPSSSHPTRPPNHPHTYSTMLHLAPLLPIMLLTMLVTMFLAVLLALVLAVETTMGELLLLVVLAVLL